jgi:hypothetical protein
MLEKMTLRIHIGDESVMNIAARQKKPRRIEAGAVIKVGEEIEQGHFQRSTRRVVKKMS